MLHETTFKNSIPRFFRIFSLSLESINVSSMPDARAPGLMDCPGIIRHINICLWQLSRKRFKVQGEQILFQLQQNSKCPSVMFLILCLVPVGVGTNSNTNDLPWNNRVHIHIVYTRSAILIKKRF